MHDVNTLVALLEALILWGVTFYGIRASRTLGDLRVVGLLMCELFR